MMVIGSIDFVPRYLMISFSSFLTQGVNLVASGVQKSLIVSGEGGLGKTYTVMKALNEKGLENYSCFSGEEIPDSSGGYRVIKGFSTAKGLYRSLYENKDGILVFDDCDSILKDSTALNLLKGALDSHDERIISWNADMKDELPRSFIFNGYVIFITNLSSSGLDKALLSRSIVIDVSMTEEQKIERMEYLITQQEFLSDYSIEVKEDALQFIKENLSIGKEISLRTLISISKIRSNVEDWKPLAKYVLVGC